MPEKTETKSYIVFVGKVKLSYEESPIPASRLLADGGATPVEKFILEGLQGESGRAVKEYQPNDMVDLNEQHSKHFRAVPSGGGRA